MVEAISAAATGSSWQPATSNMQREEEKSDEVVTLSSLMQAIKELHLTVEKQGEQLTHL